ncbi:MAG: hypothetical protein M2R45_03355 [Verrucomicrobia subdivision 3 bacterium]|nr:hypothetical protein [Limisphaerales bacterium]
MDNAKSPNRELGRTNQQKLGEYMDSVRAVEIQIEHVKHRQKQIDQLQLQPPIKPGQAMPCDESIQIMGKSDDSRPANRSDPHGDAQTTPQRWRSP